MKASRHGGAIAALGALGAGALGWWIYRRAEHHQVVGIGLASWASSPGGPVEIEPPAARRNARSRWRSPLGDDGRFAPWLLAEARGQNGVYLIRDAGSGELLYVGESHRGRLWKTLTRHLWSWTGRGSGPSYDPRGVELAIEVYESPDEAIDRQYELIRTLHPRDNDQDGHTLTLPSQEEVPF